MVAYSFQKRFAGPILAGTKGGTIRAERKLPRKVWTAPTSAYRRALVGGHALPGEEIQLYTGMRTKHCALITRKTCREVEPIALNFEAEVIAFDGREDLYDQQPELDFFAQFDGFAGWDEMREFWAKWRRTTGLLVFDGWHVRWLPLPAGLG